MPWMILDDFTAFVNFESTEKTIHDEENDNTDVAESMAELKVRVAYHNETSFSDVFPSLAEQA